MLAGVLAQDGLRDPVLAGRSITISQIRVSPDLRHATAFAMPLGGTGEAAEMIAALNRAAPWLSHQVGQRIALKFTPALRFELDTVFDEAERIDALLRSPAVARDLAADEPDASGDGA